MSVNVENPNTVLRNSSGTEIGTNANPVRVDPTGTTTQPVSGTVTANAGTGTFTISGAVTQSGTWTVQPGNTANTTPWLVAGNKTSNGAVPGTNLLGVLPAIATTAAPTYTTGNIVALSTNTSGGLRVDGSGVTQPVSIAASVAVTGPLTDAQLRATPVPVSGTVTASNASVSATGSAPPASATLSGGSVTTSAPTYTTGQMNALSLNTSGGLRVDGSGVTQPISAVSLPLPTGAATNAILTGGTQQSRITDGTNVATVKAATLAAQTTDTALVVAISPNNNVGITAASLPLPTGASTSALQTSGNNSLVSIDGKTPVLGQSTMANSVPVVISSNQSAITVNQGAFGGGASAWQTTITDSSNNIVKPGDSGNSAIRANIVASATIPVSFGSQASVTGSLAALNATLAIPSVASQSYGISVLGTWVGTITPQATIDGINWFNCRVVTRSTNDVLQTITANDNLFFYDVGGSVQLRLNMTAYTSGSATIVLTGTQLETKELLNYSGTDNDAAPPLRHLSLGTLTSVDSTMRALRQSNATPTGTEFALLSRSMMYGEGFDGYQPTPGTSIGPVQPTIDGSNRLETRAAVLTDEGSFRDDFTAATFDPEWTVTTTAGGVANATTASMATLSTPTTSGAQSAILRGGDYGPLTISTFMSISNRRTNQTILVGAADDEFAPAYCALFRFTGTSTTTVDCVSGVGSAAADQQVTTITLPYGLNTSQILRYKIDISPSQVTFSVGTGNQKNDYIVAKHLLHVPPSDPAAFLNAIVSINNTAATAGTTTILCDGIYLNNWNRIQIDSDFAGEPLPVAMPQDSNTYAAATGPFTPPASPTDIFTITGSATKTIRIQRITFTMNQTTGAARDVIVLKRSTANTGGTSVVVTPVSMDSANPSATAEVRRYTANPTLGTLVGNVRSRKVFVATLTGNNSNSDEFIMDFGTRGDTQEIFLRGTNEVLSINLNGVTSTGNSASCSVEWIEEG